MEQLHKVQEELKELKQDLKEDFNQKFEEYKTELQDTRREIREGGKKEPLRYMSITFGLGCIVGALLTTLF